MNEQIKQLNEQIIKLRQDLDSLSSEYYRNNFSGHQVFVKDCVFKTRLQVPHYSSAPSKSEVGDLIEVGGKLYICTVANTTFTLVGSQT